MRRDDVDVRRLAMSTVREELMSRKPENLCVVIWQARGDVVEYAAIAYS